MDDATSDRLLIAEREYYRLRLVLREGFDGAFADLANATWRTTEDVLRESALRRDGEPWQVVLLTLDLTADRASADQAAGRLREVPTVGEVHVQHVRHVIWSDAPFLTREPAVRAPTFYAELVLLFFAHDPMGINWDENTDEYELEVRRIVPRLELARTVGDVQQIAWEEFTTCFGDAGPRERYEQLASDLWAVWKRRR